jgi:hypothetical protein
VEQKALTEKRTRILDIEEEWNSFMRRNRFSWTS